MADTLKLAELKGTEAQIAAATRIRAAALASVQQFFVEAHTRLDTMPEGAAKSSAATKLAAAEPLMRTLSRISRAGWWLENRDHVIADRWLTAAAAVQQRSDAAKAAAR